LDILRKNYLLQYIDKPTRIRGDDEPHVLDLVLTNEPFIAGIDFLAPLGKSDHSVLHIHCTAQVRETTNVVKYNYTKRDYDSLRISCQINWEDILGPFNDDIENMWIHFKKELQDRILQFAPKQKKIMLSKKINGLALSAHLYGRL